jgi:anti-sigma B factor antagonist
LTTGVPTSTDQESKSRAQAGPLGPDLGPQLAIQCHADAQTALVVVDGEIDLASAAQIERALGDATSNASSIVIDLAAVDFIDSIGVAALIRAQRHADANNSSMTLRRTPPQARRLFELAGVADAFVSD